MESFTRYLQSKKTVDDRALNQHVWQTLKTAVSHLDEPITILEVGAGIGTMIERVITWQLFEPADQHIRWIALDQNESNIAAMQERITVPSNCTGEPVCADIYRFLDSNDARFDLIVAHAFLDLFDTAALLPPLLATLQPNGLYWFTINFDGITAFEPPIDPAFDAHIEQRYHATMDNRIINGKLSGDSRSGRHLLTQLRGYGSEVLAAGSSDWVVIPQFDGAYPADEAAFLRFIIDTVSHALADDSEIDQAQFGRWIARRHQQIDDGELVYIAHQIDMVGRSPIRPFTST